MKSISKKGSARSKMLRKVMPKLSGSNAEKLAKAIEAENPEKFKSVWKQIGLEISKTLEK
jgi:hypothetical protein